MTLDEAIKHCEEVAKHEKWMYISELQTTVKCTGEHGKYAADHRQLAEWLKELKELSLQIAAPRLGSIEEYHYELAKCKTAFWSCNRRCMNAEEQYRRKADELRKAQEQIAHYDDERKKIREYLQHSAKTMTVHGVLEALALIGGAEYCARYYSEPSEKITANGKQDH